MSDQDLSIHGITRISIGEIETLEVKEDIIDFPETEEKNDRPDSTRISYHRHVKFHQNNSVFTVTLFADNKEDLSV